LPLHVCAGAGGARRGAAGVRLGRLEAARPIEVLLPGGPLEVTVPGPGGSLLMAGPTAVVFTGRLE
jgi:diaminopimelate epimerase